MSSLENKNILTIRALIYFGISVFLILFNAIYGIFSHGVHSMYMQFAFLIPLIGGTFISLILYILPFPTIIESTIWRMGISTLIIAFLLYGVFEIYGTTVAYISIYEYVGYGLLILSFVIYMFRLIQYRFF